MFYRLVAIWYSLGWIFRTNIGDFVWYEGKKHLVVNAVRQGAWQLKGVLNDDFGWVSRVDCKKSLSPINFFNSFTNGYCFYMRNWYRIWKKDGIKLWMRKCNIW